MQNLDTKPIYIRRTIKTMVDNIPVTNYVLEPVVAKSKVRLTKEKVKALKNEKEYSSTGKHQHMAKLSANRTEDGKIVTQPFYSKRGLDAITEYRKTKALLDSTKDLRFRKLPSMVLTTEERESAIERHKKMHKVVSNLRKKAIITESYKKGIDNSFNAQLLIKELKAKQAKQKHAKWLVTYSARIAAIIAKNRKNKVNIIKVTDELDTSTNLLKREVVMTVSKRNFQKAFDKVVVTASAPTKHIFAIEADTELHILGKTILPIANAA